MTDTASAPGRCRAVASARMLLGFALPALVCIAGHHTVSIAVGQELKAGKVQGTVTPPAGMTGWRSDSVTVTTPALGMTGWRGDPQSVAVQTLGMTGWRGEPLALATPVLGMTGWQGEPIRWQRRHLV